MLRWLRQRAPFAAMGLLTLVLAHNLVFVVGYGAAYREALATGEILADCRRRLGK